MSYTSSAGGTIIVDTSLPLDTVRERVMTVLGDQFLCEDICPWDGHVMLSVATDNDESRLSRLDEGLTEMLSWTDITVIDVGIEYHGEDDECGAWTLRDGEIMMIVLDEDGNEM